MRILVIGPAWPGGRAFGGQLRAFHVGKALSEVGKVSVVVVSSEAANGNERGNVQTGEGFEVCERIPTAIAYDGSLRDKLRRALDMGYMNVHGVKVSAGDCDRLEKLSDDYDLVWVLNSRTPNIVGRWNWPHAHLDIDDVPSTYERARAASAGTVGGRWKARIQQKLLHRRELLLKERFTTLSVCSEGDRQYLRGGPEMHVIPNGFERPESEPVRNRSTNPPVIGFIGLYDYAPNREGIAWFLENCWPLLRKSHPCVHLRLIGTGTEVLNERNLPGVTGLGWIENPAPEIAKWSAMVVPIRVGGGTRVKIADAYSRKCPIVSTTLGAFGYDAEDGKQLRLADRAEDFAAACVQLIEEPAKAAAMAERAWTEFLEKWTWESITPKIVAAAEDCLQRGKPKRMLAGT